MTKITVIEITLEDGEYCGYFRGSPVTKQKTLEKAAKKMAAYVKGQS